MKTSLSIARPRLGNATAMLLLFGNGGCNPPTGTCTLLLDPGVQVQFLEAGTTDRLNAPYVAGIARDGAFVDSTRADPLQGVLYLAGSREGTYRVEVRAPGYGSFVREGVRVRRKDECKVETVYLTASLARES